MARARNIKPAFFTNELLGTQEPIVGMTFIGLWCLADRNGVLEDRPLRIKAELFPYRENLDVNGYLTVLQQLGFIHRYVVDGVGYIQVANFSKHQTPHNTEKSKNFPKYQQVESVTVTQPLHNGEITEQKRPDLLIPDSLIPESRHQKHDSETHTETVEVQPVKPSLAAAVCVFLKSEGIGSVNPQNPTLVNLIKDGADIGMFAEAARISKEKGKGFSYVLGIVKGQLHEAQSTAKQARDSPSKLTETAYQRSMRERFEEATGKRTITENMVIDITPMNTDAARIA